MPDNSPTIQTTHTITSHHSISWIKWIAYFFLAFFVLYTIFALITYFNVYGVIEGRNTNCRLELVTKTLYGSVCDYVNYSVFDMLKPSVIGHDGLFTRSDIFGYWPRASLFVALFFFGIIFGIIDYSRQFLWLAVGVVFAMGIFLFDGHLALILFLPGLLSTFLGINLAGYIVSRFKKISKA